MKLIEELQISAYLILCSFILIKFIIKIDKFIKKFWIKCQKDTSQIFAIYQSPWAMTQWQILKAWYFWTLIMMFKTKKHSMRRKSSSSRRRWSLSDISKKMDKRCWISKVMLHIRAMLVRLSLKLLFNVMRKSELKALLPAQDLCLLSPCHHLGKSTKTLFKCPVSEKLTITLEMAISATCRFFVWGCTLIQISNIIKKLK